MIARLIASLFLFLVVGSARAEDIDIFQINPSVPNLRPNVLIILDNSANWSSTDSVGGGSKYENVRKALSNTINGLTDQFNVGIMLFGETGGDNDSVDGGVVRAGLRQMNSTNKPKYKALFDTIDGNYDKTNNTAMGLSFAEAYYYFTGQASVSGKGKVKREYFGHTMPTTGNQANNNPTLAESNAIWGLAKTYSDAPTNSVVLTPALTDSSSTTYNRPIIDPCQKNFIIFIANGVVSDNSSNNSDATSKLLAAGGDTTSISGTEDNITDEWARFLANNDILPDATYPDFPGKQTVFTYTVEVNPVTNGQGPASTALMQSVAFYGKGKYFAVSSASNGAAITEALNKIFAEVLAVNSVFASSTLPVSVNVRGTFLNQVYMGVFRPDGNSSPRWPGNVKQYTLKDTSGKLFLADKDGAAVENAATGFVSPSAKSYWTYSGTTFWNNSYYPDTVAKAPLTASTADLPDGEFVEKGGAAQHLRQNGSAERTDLTTRKLYTCISCAADTHLNSGSNNFDDANAGITNTLLGLTGAQTMTSLARSGTTATATFAAAHGFSNGQVVQIAGAADSAYNGNFTITTSGPTSTTFTYTITESPVTTATTTGTMLAAPSSGSVKSISSITRTSCTSGTCTITVQVATPPHTFTDSQTITISGTGDSSYEGSKVIANATANQAAGTFTFTTSETPVTPATAVGTITVATRNSGAEQNIKTAGGIQLTRSGTTVTIGTTNNHNFAVGDTAVVAGVTPSEYNGTYTLISPTSGKTATYTLTSTGPTASITSATQPAMSADPALTKTITSLTRGTAGSCTSSGCTATATATTSAAHGFTASTSVVTISGATQSEYNKTVTVATTPTTTTFTYPVTVTPGSPASGTITAQSSGTLTKTDLVRWVRGENRQLTDNPTVLNTRVRGYLHGDVLHSRPAVVNYNRTGQPTDRDVVVYYGSNDGIVHAVKGGQDDTDGYEMWGFVPSEFFSQFARLYQESPVISSSNPRTYFADGPLSVDAVYVSDRIEGTGAKAQLYAGMRRGGRVYYSLDVTSPGDSSSSPDPIFKWKIDNATSGFSELGQSWAEMKVAKINVIYPPPSAGGTTAAARKVLIFSGGYDAPANDSATQGTATMGRAVYVVDADTGALIWFTTPKALADVTVPTNATYKQTSGMIYAIPADVTVINSDNDGQGYADRIYAVDTGANIWRINIGDTNPANWTVGQVASLGGAAAADQRRYLFPADVVPFDSTTDSILVGTGNREQPFDTTVSNRFYMVKDSHSMDAQPSTPATESDLCDLTDNNLQGSDASLKQADLDCLADSSKKGWLIRLGTGEKVVTGATTLGGTTTFATNIPASQATPGSCTGSLGEALIYAVSFKDATSTIDFNSNGVLGQAERAVEKPGGGFPPSPVPVSIKIGDKYYEAAITGTQVINPPSSTIGKRYRVFWNMSIDN